MKKVMLAVVSVFALSSYAFAAENKGGEVIYLAAAIGSGASTSASSAGATSGAEAAGAASGATANMVAVGIVAAAGIAVAVEAGSTTTH